MQVYEGDGRSVGDRVGWLRGRRRGAGGPRERSTLDPLSASTKKQKNSEALHHTMHNTRTHAPTHTCKISQSCGRSLFTSASVKARLLCEVICGTNPLLL